MGSDDGGAAPPAVLVPGNLPAQLTSFVGRGAELPEVTGLLTGARLVTLTGPGGAGKTRLALQAAADLAGRPERRYPDGVWWVELIELTDGDAIADAVTAVTGGLADPAPGALARLAGQLAGRRALIGLDNAEHLLDAVAGVAEALLRACPALTLLVTSREPLDVEGEVVWQVPPLADDEAVALFESRARLARPGFRLDPAGEAAVRSIAVHLDGIPLAIELAAAWLRTLTPQQIEASLDDRFTLLVRGPRGAHRRQRTLAASIEWSHALLDATDRVVFRRLAVFAGSFGLAAARAVCAGDPVTATEVLASIGRLVDKSLVVMEEHGTEARYRLLETVRAFATARLLEAGEATDRHDRQLAWAVDAVEGGEAARERDPDGWRQALHLDYPNLRAALEHGLDRPDPEGGRRLAAGLAWLWHLDRRGHEGMAYLRRALDRAPADRSQLQARLLAGVALVADTAGPLDLEYDVATRALELATAVGDEHLRALCLNLAAVGAFYTDFDTAWELAEQAHQAAGRSGNGFVLGGARALQALVLHLRDQHAEAEALAGPDVLDRLRVHRGVLSTLLGFRAQGALATGQPGRALALAEEALRVAEPLGDFLRVGSVRSVLALVRAVTGDEAGAEAAMEPILRRLDGAAGEVFAPGLAIAMGVLSRRRGDPVAAAGWFAAEAGSTDRGRRTYLAARALPLLGSALAAAGRPAEAQAALEEAVDVAGRLGMPAALADALEARAELAGPLEGGLEPAYAALDQRADHGLRGFLPGSLELVARLRSASSRVSGPAADDVRLLAAADAARAALGLPRGSDREPAVRDCSARLRQALGEEFGPAWAEGAGLTLDEAVAYARRARGTRGRPAAGWASLTPTELEVVKLVAGGLSNTEIGGRLFISRGTVKTHLSHVFTKLAVANRTELATLAAQNLPGGE